MSWRAERTQPRASLAVHPLVLDGVLQLTDAHPNIPVRLLTL